MRFKTLKASLFTGLLAASVATHATIVRFETSLGDFDVNLFDEYTPETVENFLAYVESGAYEDTFIHRSAPNFVVQGGGFIYDANFTSLANIADTPKVPQSAPVINEPVLSNQRGTIAMAKRGGYPNSATSEWFFNLQDNSGGGPNLDNQNGGFTVFGQVMGDGMAILEEINSLPLLKQTAFAELPLLNYSDEDKLNKAPITDENRVMIYGITVVDPAVDTAADLEPVLAIKQSPPPPQKKKKKSGAPGSEFLLVLAGLALSRRWWK